MTDERSDRVGDGLDEDAVGRLIRLADDTGPTPEALDRARLTLRPHWQRTVARSRRRRQVAAAAALAAAVVVGLAVIRWLPGHRGAVIHPVATVARVVGEVELHSAYGGPDRAVVAAAGAALAPGVRLETTSSSRVALLLEGGTSVRLDVDSRLLLPSAGVLVLERGAVYGDRSAGGSLLEVRAGGATVRDIGTQFEVRRFEDGLSVTVREGRVEVRAASTAIEVAAGSALRLGTDGSISRVALSAAAAHWDWTRAVAPPFAIDGRSAIALLDWVSRETGLAISFEDAEVERFAGRTLLYGPAVSMSPEAAPTALLPACGLDARREGDAFVIGWRESPAGEERQEVGAPES